MLKSMTGYGRGSYEDAAFSFVIEIKTVNHRYNEVAMRLPRFLNPLEDKIRKAILAKVARGRVDVFVTASYEPVEGYRLKVDKNLVKAYNKALQEIGSQLGVEDAAVGQGQKLFYIAKCQDVISTDDALPEATELWPLMEGAINEALTHLLQMREAEGQNISGDIKNRADLIETKLLEIEQRAPLVVTEYQEKLRLRVEELLKGCAEGRIAEERLMQEVAIFADRVNITEELVRLKSHLQQFKAMLASVKPIGRKMDFLVQEFNREANTIASKANDLTITALDVEIKAEIEKIREQIQNIE